MKKKYIDPMKLKMSIAINNMYENPKKLEDIIDSEPYADVAEVVWCYYCKHFRHDECNDEFWCKKTGADIERKDIASHFCGYGERK